MSKMGRPKGLIYDEQGNLVVGLSYDKAADTYFASFKDEQGKFKKKNFGRDKTTAIQKFTRWKEGEEPFDFVDNAVANHWLYTKKIILEDPALAAKLIDIADLADPDLFKKYRQTKSYTLTEIGDNYFNRVNHIHPREQKAIKAGWTKFINIIKVKTTKELNKEIIRKYFDSIYSEFKRKDNSTAWVKSHFEKVKRVFNYALDTFETSEELRNIKQSLNQVLKPPPARNKSQARRIPKEIFWQIMNKSTTEEKAMWLISANLAYYSQDIVSLPLSHINFKDKTVIFRRGKTGEHRAGVLWDETIEAIRAYQQETPHNSELLFINMQQKKPYVSNRIRKKFVKILDELKLREKVKDRKFNPNNIVHNNFRDTFKSVAREKHCSKEDIDAILGHKNPISDAYTDVEAKPEIAAPACKAVREFYFGNQKKTADDKEQNTMLVSDK